VTTVLSPDLTLLWTGQEPADRTVPTQRAGSMVPPVGSPDAVLVARLSAGDEEALAEVWQRHGPLVFGLARRLTGDSSTAEDVAQEVFVTLWQHPDRFDPVRGSLRSYLGIQAHRRAVDVLRRTGRRCDREQRYVRLQPDADVEIGSQCDQAALLEAVRDAISRLPAEQREAVLLAYFDGLTCREVATALGIPEGTAKSRLRLARTKLQTWLTPQVLELA
jgi:RNA polymerase sigma-70 factor, ECF subfamily